MTGFDSHTPIVVQTSEYFHDDNLATVCELDCHVIADDTGDPNFEDEKFELQPGTFLTPDGGNLVFHGATGEFYTGFGSVLAVWYPPAGDVLYLKGGGDALYVTGFTYYGVIFVGA